MTSTSVSLCLALLGLAALGSSSRLPQPVGVLFNSSSTTQYKLHLASWMAFRDTLPDEADSSPPHLLDIAHTATPQQAADWLVGNGTQSLLSLLEPSEIIAFLHSYELVRRRESNGSATVGELSVVLLRECVSMQIRGPFRIRCKQLGPDAVATAIVHRASKIGVTRLLPVTLRSAGDGDVSPAQLYCIYKKTIHHVTAAGVGTSPKLAPLSHGLDVLRAEIKIHNQAGTNSSAAAVLGVLVLDRDPFALQRVLQAITNVHEPTRLLYTFTPWGLDALEEPSQVGLSPYLRELPFVNRLYTVIGGDAGGREPAARLRTLRELNEFMGPSPLLLTALAAYDAAASLLNEGTGTEAEADPPSSGVLYGISPKPTPAILASHGALLQPSDYILEDVLQLAQNDDGTFRVVGYHVGTSSVLSRQDLATLAAEAESRINCSRPLLQVTSYDPFSRQSCLYRFGHGAGARPLPQYLLIPNMHGYGLDLECLHAEEWPPALVTNLRIACTPTPAGDSVNCFRSRWNHRVRRAAPPLSSSRHMAMAPRDDTMAAPMAASAYYQPYMAMMQADMTTGTPEPASTEAPSSPPPSHPPPPPPDLRQVIKAAKPFMGGCIGSSLGCAMCVLILGRLSALGSSPAICSGPCFTGVFGQCGALLGRVGSETTVVCTELFRQGHIDVDTFLADAEFGRRMQKEAPHMLAGYRFLATPLVHAMRASPAFTELVAVLTAPWAEHMQELSGHGPNGGKVIGKEKGNNLGAWIHAIGAPICEVIGRLAICGQNLSLGMSVVAASALCGCFLARRSGFKYFGLGHKTC